jgi:predicted alpha-1,2-mannosidase
MNSNIPTTPQNMKTRRLSLLTLAIYFSLGGFGPRELLAQNFVKYVNPWMGTIGAGSTSIGPQLPWGSINPGPDTPDGNTDGYNPNQKIRGFSQLHVTGTGGMGKYGQFLISPQIGLNVAEDGHDSGKAEEVPQASSYKVRLTNYDILCEFTPTKHAAIYRFTFPKSSESHLAIDLGHNIPKDSNGIRGGYADQGSVTVDPEKRLVRGWGQYWGGWSSEPFIVYFAAKYEKPAEVGTWKNGATAPKTTNQNVDRKGDRIGAYLQFDTQEKEQVFLKIAVSFSSMEQALAYLDEEIPAWDFEKTNAAADVAWNEKLGKIAIEGASEDEKFLFYTCLYNTMRMPRDRSGDNPHWKSNEPFFDDHFCVWDTWRTVFPLHTIINESFVRDNVKAFLDRYRHNGQVLDAFIAGNDRVCAWFGDDNFYFERNQGGDNVDNVVADAYVKKVPGIDWAAAYDLLKNSANAERAASFRANDCGWVPFRRYEYGTFCSRSVEFSYNDFCVAEVARGLGHEKDAARFFRRSQGWENMWNPAAESDGYRGFLVPRLIGGAWATPYDPKRDSLSTSTLFSDRCFGEGNAWIYSYFVPHDYARLIALTGGKKAYCDRLTHALDNNMIDFGNEPSFLTPFSFIYAGRPDLTSFWVRKNVANYTKDGFPGDEDSGAMGSWFVFATLGFFPNAGQNVYLVNGPAFPKAVITLENGKQIVIEAVNASRENVYVQSATLDGKPLDRAWLRHEDFRNGAAFRFVMGPKPSEWGQTSIPPSLSDGK